MKNVPPCPPKLWKIPPPQHSEFCENFLSNYAYQKGVFQGSKNTKTTIYAIIHGKKSQKRGLYYMRSLTEDFKNCTTRNFNF